MSPCRKSRVADLRQSDLQQTEFGSWHFGFAGPGRIEDSWAAMSDAFHWPEFLPAFAREAEARGFLRNKLLDCEAGELVAWERPGAGQPLYVSAGIHGDEPAGPLAMLELMKSGFFSEALSWSLCPALNPDGLARGIRGNAMGADLNRDYLLRATPEVAAHCEWIESRPVPGRFISLHEDWETMGFYLYEINLMDDDTIRASRILAAAEPWFPREEGPLIDGHEIRAPGWIHHAADPDLPEGWPEAIFLAKRGCPLSFTLESPSRASLAIRVAAQVAATRAACDC
jgi:murein peptide amidase A